MLICSYTKRSARILGERICVFTNGWRISKALGSKGALVTRAGTRAEIIENKQQWQRNYLYP